MHASLSLGKIADIVDGDLRGDRDLLIHGIQPIEYAQPNQITWLASASHVKRLADSKAGAVLCSTGLDFGNKAAVLCKRPDIALIELLKIFSPDRGFPAPGIHPSANVDATATVGNNVSIGPGVVVQAGARIGDGTVLQANSFLGFNSTLGDSCLIWPNAVILDHCEVGNRVTIHPNATVGADGFGYTQSAGEFKKIPHIGIVRIEDDVEIGAGTCIDRAKSHETVIGRGTKIDNLVQVGHNVRIGMNCCICAQVGIAGSTEIGDNVMLGGKVGVKDNIRLGSRIKVFAYSAVAGNLDSDNTYLGIPAEPQAVNFDRIRTARKMPAIVRQFGQVMRRLTDLEKLLHLPETNRNKGES